MIVRIFEDPQELAAAAGAEAARVIKQAIVTGAKARVVAATGSSQCEFLRVLIATLGIDWRRVELFHLDEYIGLPSGHPASMQRYIRERFMKPAGITRAHLLDGMADPQKVRMAAGAAISAAPIDVAFAGIGENGHLAFNDPPADFSTKDPFLIVELDEGSRRQQVSEGWFQAIDEVPRRAVSMSVSQILQARTILCLAWGARKAKAVEACFEGQVSPMAPASALRLHSNAITFLDRDAASLLHRPR